MDDEFMTQCFENAPECIEFVLRIILDKTDLHVVESITQAFAANILNRSVCLDILADDSQGVRYNIEIQKANSGAGYKRARYHSSMLDINLLQKRKNFDELPETYVIFITENDVIGRGQPLYPVERYFSLTGERFDDGTHILYVNGACKDDTPLGRLMQDFVNKEPSTMNYDILAERVKFFKESKEGIAIMSGVMEEMLNEAKQEANKANALRMLASGVLTLEQIADFSGLTLEEVKKLKNEKTA